MNVAMVVATKGGNKVSTEIGWDRVGTERGVEVQVGKEVENLTIDRTVMTVHFNSNWSNCIVYLHQEEVNTWKGEENSFNMSAAKYTNT